jgi:cytochrome c5
MTMQRASTKAAMMAAAGLLVGCGDSGGGEGGGSGESGGGSSGGASVGEASSGGEAPTGGGEEESGSASGTTGAEANAGPWDQGVYIPPEPQTDGDAALGYEALVTKGYISCGIPKAFFGLAKSFISPYADGEPLPGRPGDNADVPFNWNVHEVDGVKIVSQNCLQCHAGHFNGQLIVGLGSAEVDFTSDMAEKMQGLPIPPEFDIPGIEQMTRFMNRVKVLGPQTVMRTVGTNPAEMVAVTLVAHRDRHTLAWSDEELLPVPDIVVPSDPPPWWRAHKKNALFYNAMARGDHRGTMMLATALCTDTVEEAAAIDAYFHHIQAFIRSVRAPKYPWAIDAALAGEGEAIFIKNCAGCHGTYSDVEEEETYPNLLFPLDVIGTDPAVAEGGTKYAPHLVDWYNESFYGKITRMEPSDPFPGYMAPPLDGVWATGPFLHNGSVPTIELVLDSTNRPTYWKREDFNSANFDQSEVGWPYMTLTYGHDAALEEERKFIYDTTQEAHTNVGHTFGDHLTTDERRAVLEYLKTL